MGVRLRKKHHKGGHVFNGDTVSGKTISGMVEILWGFFSLFWREFLIQRALDIPDNFCARVDSQLKILINPAAFVNQVSLALAHCYANLRCPACRLSPREIPLRPKYLSGMMRRGTQHRCKRNLSTTRCLLVCRCEVYIRQQSSATTSEIIPGVTTSHTE